jgi:Na+/proline symporter
VEEISMTLNLVPTFIMLACFFAMLLGIQFFLSTRIKEAEDYMLAGKSLGMVQMTCITAAGAIFGGISLGAVEMGYFSGISGAFYGVFGGFMLIFVGTVLAPRFRMALDRHHAMTMPDLLDKCFGSGISQVYAWIYIPVVVVFIGGAITGSTAPLVSILTGLGPVASQVISLIAFASIIFMAGYMGASWQSVGQAALIVVGCLVALVVAFGQAKGWDHTTSALARSSHFSPVGMGWGKILTIAFSLAPGMIYDQFWWQMVASGRNNRSVSWGFTLGGLIFAFACVVCALIGVAYAASHPGEQNPIEYIPKALVSASPVGGGLFMAGVLCSNILVGAMSFIVTSTILTHDIYAKIRRQALGRSEELWVNRGMVALLLVLCILFAIFVPGKIIEYLILMLSFGASLAWPTLAALFHDKFQWVTGSGCVGGTVLGFITVVIWGIILKNPFEIDAIFPTLFVSLVGNIVISLLTKPAMVTCSSHDL